MENSIKGPDPPPCYGRKKLFFSQTRTFFENFLKKVYFHPRKPKKTNFSKILYVKNQNQEIIEILPKNN